MTRNEFIEQVNDFGGNSIKEFLKTNCSEEIKQFKYLNGCDKEIELDKKFAYSDMSLTDTVYVKNVIGTRHGKYYLEPLNQVLDILKRPGNLEFGYKHKIENYFTGDLSEYETISVLAYNDEKEEEKFSIKEGSHRFTISKVIDSIVDENLFINDVAIKKYFLDYEFLNLLDRARKEKSYFNGFKKIDLSPHEFNIITKLVIEDEKYLEGLKKLPINEKDWSVEKYYKVEKHNRELVKEFLKKSFKIL